MTDNEIIKALECCTNEDGANCEQCTLDDLNRNDCYSIILHKHSLDLINRLKSDYEALQAIEEKEHQYCKNVCESRYKAEIKRLMLQKNLIAAENELHKMGASDLVLRHRAEAIKEFAERLKKIGYYEQGSGKFVFNVTNISIDNLVNEMCGD